MFRRLIRHVKPTKQGIHWEKRSSFTSTQTNVMQNIHINATPYDALVDEKVEIVVDGLENSENITIQASLFEDNLRFSSFGCFTATESGKVVVSKLPAQNGTYTGIEPMGLFWSMIPEPTEKQNIRLMRKDVTKPLRVKLSVFSGHLTWESLFDNSSMPLATSEVLRWYLHKDVKREEVRHGSIRGTLFTPPGDGPFPGVIDLFGSSGGLFEYRASLLASRGFCVLALAFFGYDDLPKHMGQITLDYFEESVEWLSNLPLVNGHGVGVIGVSKGATIAMIMSVYISKVKAVVNINGAPFNSECPLHYSKGDLEIPAVDFEMGKFEFSDEGANMKYCLTPKDEDFFKTWESDVSLLYIVGEDDHCVNPAFISQFESLVPTSHRHRYKFIKYPGAGHLIEPPYAPYCKASYHKYLGFNLIWGGLPKEHNAAQEDSWEGIQRFLSRELQAKDDMLKSKL